MMGKRTLARSLVLVAAVAALTLAFATTAFAAPTVPTLGIDALRSKLASSPSTTLPAHMMTVVKGEVIVPIEITIKAVPIAGRLEDTLIVFEGNDPKLTQYGGIVAGMSGSPIYLDGTGELIGAVSYGKEFSLTGLATPIDAMSRIETLYSTAIVPLSTRIITSDGIYNKIIITSDPASFSAAAAEGAFVASPLSTIHIGGLRPTSTGFKAVAKDLAARGLGTVSSATPLVSGGGDETAFSTEVTAGASIAAATMRGSAWMGGVGTVTYVNGANVLAFGHPAWWSGATCLYMGNASIEDIWPSAEEPEKIPDFGQIRGTITQDRLAGIMGKLGTFPTETTITATATNVDPDAAIVTTTSAVYAPRQLITNGFLDDTVLSEAAYVAAANLFDQGSQPGSAHTTTTVDVMDRKGNSYHIVMSNYCDSTSDIAWQSASDVSEAVANLQSVLAWGADDAKITSINLTGEYSTHRKGATIVGVEAPNGLRVGANHIVVKTLAYGEDDTQTVDATLTIPAGTATAGTLVASAVGGASSDDSLSSILDDLGISLSVDTSAGRRSIAQIADSLNHSNPDNTIEITFQPSLSGLDGSESSTLPSTDPITLDVAANWPILGEADVSVTTIAAEAVPNVIPYGDFPWIVGQVNGPSTPTTVTLYARQAGSSVETTVATTKATVVDGTPEFSFDELDQLFTTTTYRIHVDGTTGYTGADAYVTVYVKARVSLTTSASRIKPGKSVTLSASVFPNSAVGGTVAFERQSGSRWVSIKSVKLTASGSYAKATYTWKPGKGTQKVRARYTGGTKNYASTSSTKIITVK